MRQVQLKPRIVNAYVRFELEAENMNVSSCKARLESLKENWAKFEKNNDDLYSCDTYNEVKDQPYFKDNYFENVELQYLDILGKFRLYIDTHQTAPNHTVHNSSHHASMHYVNEDFDRLPRMDLPEFDGAFQNWESFRDIFVSSVVNKENMPKVTKLRHLRKCLKGDAANLVQSYPLTEQNFEIVWTKLKDRYEVKKRLVSAHVSSIFSLKRISRPSAIELKRILDGVNTPVSALKVLKRPVEHWDDLLVYHVVSLLDVETKRQWELFYNNPNNNLSIVNPVNVSTPLENHAQATASKLNSEPPSFAKLIEFLELQISIMESLEESDKSGLHTLASTSNNKNSNVSTAPAKVFSTQIVNNSSKKFKLECLICKQDHHFSQCNSYLSKSQDQRKAFVHEKKRCINCLGNHFMDKCKSAGRCKTCKKKHHTTLHIQNLNQNQNVKSVNVISNDCELNSSQESFLDAEATVHLCDSPNTVLLATALVKIIDETGHIVTARALIDNCSQASFISESLYKRLHIPYQSAKLPISGVLGKTSFVCKKWVNFILKPWFYSDFSMEIDAYVLPKVSSYSPNVEKEIQSLAHLSSLNLADPHFFERGRIDLLIGTADYSSLIIGDIKKGNPGQPIAIKSFLGWLISGGTNTQNNVFHSLVVNTDESNFICDLERFWKQEELSDSSSVMLTPEEQECEDFFLKTHYRTPDGRYVVRLPFKINNLSELKFPGSFFNAKRILLKMEERFSKNPHFKSLYIEFMKDYQLTKHMMLSCHIIDLDSYYFTPHHGVLKKHSLKPKLRTVFNGSAKSSNNISINDVLHTGANLLPDLAELLISWMKYRFVFVSDIKQMFRQILVNKADQKFQQILWRFDPNDKIRAWSLQTVTYGMVSSPYLAIRVTKQLAVDEGHRFPLGAEILSKETYMDDTLSGGHTLEEATKKQADLINICKVGGFELHKWMANHKSLLSQFSDDLQSDSDPSHSYFSLLGLNWNPSEDSFFFKIEIDQFKKSVTKRTVVSSIAKLYDPLGWLAPVIITAKAFIQKLWLAKIDWEDKLSQTLEAEFLNWYNQIPLLNGIKINRWLGFLPNAKFEIYGFADASKIAYAACVYLKIIRSDKAEVRLIQAKSKVAPLKPLLTIPKLELNAALLLAKLVKKVENTLKLEFVNTYLFTDSTDVLYWLKDHPSKWNQFVANRCSQIHNLLPDAFWNHVRSGDNPADCISRGITPEQLLSFSLWWEGSRLIKNTHLFVKKDAFQTRNICNSNCHCACLSANTNTKNKEIEVWDLLNRYSNLSTLLRITSIILRFIFNIIKKSKKLKTLTNSNLFSNNWFKLIEVNKSFPIVTVAEKHRAKLTWFYIIQHAYFDKEFKIIKHNGNLKNSSITRLNPFVDQNLLRLGGRFNSSLMDYDQKFPFILPYKNMFSTLLVKSHHNKTLHGGVNLTLSSVRQEVWIVKGRSLVKKIIHSCHSCIRYNASRSNQKMGFLPSFRIERPDKPFRVTGVDYAGPITILNSRGRGSKTSKAYLAVFICMASRAVHLELVTGYTSKDFIAAFRRFTSTRGQCSILVSDRGTNFVGADKILKELYIESSTHMQELENLLVDEGTSWVFNPPGSPHFGGLWEAAVKSVKHHLRRVLGNHKLTFEELYTLIKQIEACLNSRPLIPLTDDPTDRQIICPSMILHQSNSYILPEPDYTNDKILPTQRYKQVQNMVQDWWKTWSLEYLHTLQERHKWKQAMRDIQVDDIVLISDETMPPSKWPLARVIKTYQGDDGLTRVASLRTSVSELKRPIHKLVLLETHNN